MWLIVLLVAGSSAAKAPQSLSTSAPPTTSAPVLLPPTATSFASTGLAAPAEPTAVLTVATAVAPTPSTATLTSLRVGQGGEQTNDLVTQIAAGGDFAAMTTALAALAQQNEATGILPPAAASTQKPGPTDFLKLLQDAVPVACVRSPCLQLSEIPWAHITKTQCLVYMSATETCLTTETSCKTPVILAQPRACCETLAGGSGVSVGCPAVLPADVPIAITTSAITATAITNTSSTPVIFSTPAVLSAPTVAAGKAKAKAAGKAKGKNVAIAPTPVMKAGKAGKSQSAGRPTISAPCTCFETVPLPAEGELFDKNRCVQHVATLQKCLIDSKCVRGPDMTMLSACCDLLPGGAGYNAACTDPAAVLTSFLQSDEGMRGVDIGSFLTSGVNLESLMQLTRSQAMQAPAQQTGR